MNEKKRLDIQDAAINPIFWKRWNYPDGKEFRKDVLGLLEENKILKEQNDKLLKENDYLRLDNDFLQRAAEE